MAMTPDELEALTFSHLPEDFVRRAVRGVFAAHKIGWDDTRNAFAQPEADNLRPFYRRAKLEGFLREAAELVPGVEAVVERSEGTFWNHTIVQSGAVLLTESTVQSPCALVKKADFRLTLAQSAQLSLFDEQPPDDARLYVLLIHSRYHAVSGEDLIQNGHLPGSAYLAFPARDLESYVHEINLFDRYPEIVRSYMPQEWDTEAQVSYLSRARKAMSA